jgi:hypothetical protein
MQTAPAERWGDASARRVMSPGEKRAISGGRQMLLKAKPAAPIIEAGTVERLRTRFEDERRDAPLTGKSFETDEKQAGV